MTTTTQTAVTTQVYRVYIKAAPQAIWDAITKPEWTERYGFGGRVEYELCAGEREAEGAGGGWSWVLSDLKTLLETGASFRG